MPSHDPHLRLVILAGGIGSRFWPASTPGRPKQLLPLASSRPLVVDTVERALKLVPRDRLRILASRHLVAPIQDALGEADPELFWVEPRARGTGPVLAWAAHRMAREDPEAIMVSLHSDHFIDPPAAFLDLLPRAADLAVQHDLLLTVAVPPDRPETGYGYLRPGEPLESPSGPRAWRVGAFVEKPDEETARRYLADGYLWNSGIFIWGVARFLEEVKAHTPELARHLPLLDEERDEEFFQRVSPISVDEAVLERSGRVGTVEATFRWDDVGNWTALARTRSPDGSENVLEGDVEVVDASRNIVWAEDGPVVLFGVSDLVVARSAGITLVTTRDRAAALKELVQRLPASLQAPRTAGSEAKAEVTPRSSSGEEGR